MKLRPSVLHFATIGLASLAISASVPGSASAQAAIIPEGVVLQLADRDENGALVRNLAAFGAISADGSKVLFTTIGNSGYATKLFMRDVAASTTVEMVNSSGDNHIRSDAVMSADGQVVAYTIQEAESPENTHRLYVLDRSTGATEYIADDPVPLYPTLSADGRYLTYRAYNGSSLDSVFLLDRNTGITETIANESIEYSGLAMTPDASLIAFNSNTGGDGLRQILLHDRTLATTTIAVRGSAPYTPLQTALSDDGKYLAYAVSDTRGRWWYEPLKAVDVFDLTTGATSRALESRYGQVPEKDFFSGDGRFAIDIDSRSLFVHDRESGEKAAVFTSASGLTSGVGMSHDGRWMVLTACDPDLFDTPYCEHHHIALISNPFLPPPTLPDPTDCSPECLSNVMFLPGIESSRLYEPQIVGGDENKLWEPSSDGDVRSLYLGADGRSSREVYAKEGDVLDEIPVTGSNVYKSFIADMDELKATGKINDWEPIAYDWRLSLDDLLQYGGDIDGQLYYTGAQSATSTPYIIQELRQLADTSRNGKVTIVAHSNGGLVAKALIKKLRELQDPLLDKIDTLVLVDVPQVGTPTAIGVALHGFEQALPSKWLPFLMTPETAREFASTSPMAYHLLPSASYFSGDGINVFTPPVTFDDSPLTQSFIQEYGQTITTDAELHNFLLGTDGRAQAPRDDLQSPTVLSPSLLSYGEGVHAALDDDSVIPSSITVHEIAGWGNDTLASIRYFTGTSCTRSTEKGICLEYTPVIQYSPETVIDGDGTVISASQLALSASSPNVHRWWVNLSDYNRSGLLGSTINRDHKDILEVLAVRQLIRDNIITATTTVVPEFITSTQPPADLGDSRLIFKLHSPLTLSVTDSSGNEVSLNVEHIPGATFRRFGEVQFISVPANAHPTVHLSGYATGSFTLEIEEQNGDTAVATAAFAGIPTSATTEASMTFPDGTIANASPLTVDVDGVGDIELTLDVELNDTVMPARPTLTIVADNATSTLGNAIPHLIATLAGFLDGDTPASSVSGEAECVTSSPAESGVGVYPIRCTIGTLASDTYDFSIFVPGTLAIVYRWDGFVQPINDTAHQIGQQLSVFKAGSTVPVKLQLKGADGTPVQGTSAPTWLAPQKGLAMSAPVGETAYSDPGTTGTLFTWDGTNQQYTYNWSTKGLSAGYWYKVFVKLGDGTIQTVVVGLR